jgi:hypothetical protein
MDAIAGSSTSKLRGSQAVELSMMSRLRTVLALLWCCCFKLHLDEAYAAIQYNHAELTPVLHITNYLCMNREAESRNLYLLAPDMTHPFTATVRLQLIWEILRAKTRNGGAEIGLKKMVIKQQIKAFYPKVCYASFRTLSDYCAFQASYQQLT